MNQDFTDGRRSLLKPYSPPAMWTHYKDSLDPSEARKLVVPSHKVQLINSPTPIERFSLPELPEDTPPLFLKRDDLTGGIGESGNKSRKLEFLLADAILQGCETIITAGGTQSNHVRQTAAACAKLKLPLDVVVRKDSNGVNGNVLLNRLFGARMKVLSKDDYVQGHTFEHLKGRAAAMAEIESDLKHKKPYNIPVGGTSPVGTWGYIDAAREIISQNQEAFEGPFHHAIGSIVTPIGSSGTACGLGVGMHLYSLAAALREDQRISVFGYGTGDTIDEIYDVIDSTLLPRLLSKVAGRQIVSVKDAKGLGYGKSTTDELQFLSRVARETGVVFDRCYSCKALMGMWRDLKSNEPFSTTGKRLKDSGRGILFIHTGGSASLFAAEDALEPLLAKM